jgi:hypothetical protein
MGFYGKRQKQLSFHFFGAKTWLMGPQKPSLHRDFFLGMIDPNLGRRAQW